MMQNNRKGEGRTLYGPRTKDDIEPPVEEGWWDIPELCTKLKSMDVGADVSRVALTAIPTVWARPVLFGTALLDVKHRLHEEILPEWRGLLGVFCFQSFFNWIIRSHPYQIGEHSSEKLEQVLDQFTRDSRWRTIDLIYVDDILIGATSPLSLFFTPPVYRCPKRIPWVEKDGRLGDPTKYLKQMRMRKELGVLRKWIQNTKEKISGIESDVFGNPGIKDELLGVFQKWFEDIGDYEDVGSVKFISSILDREPYQSASYVSSYRPEKTSDFFLDSNRTQDLPPIVITEEGWKQPEKVVYSPFIVDNIRRSDIPKELRGPAGKLDLPYKGEYLQPKYLFTDRVLRIPMDKDSSMFYHEEGYVPPLRNEILDYFLPEELRKVFKWLPYEGGVKAVLSIPLRNRRGAPPIRRIEISHTYEAEDIDDCQEAPIMGIWPNFEADAWQHYYFISKRDQESEFVFEPAKTKDKFERGNSVLWMLPHYPEVITCKKGHVDLGLIFPIPPRILGAAMESKEWHVSIDFGTTNTIVCCKEGADDSPKPMEFQDRLISLVKVHAEDLENFFVSEICPSKGGAPVISGILPSIVRQLGDLDSPRPFIEGILFQILHMPKKVPAIMKILNPNVKHNMKWSNDPQVRKLIRTLHEYLLILVCAEAREKRVRKITLHWSYPSSFLQNMIEDMTNNWEFLENTGKKTGIQIKVEKPWMESTAVCRYLGSRDAVTGSERMTAVIDIGGGTSDIGIWQSNEIRAQTSIRLAGHIMGNYLQKNPKFYKELFRVSSQKASSQYYEDIKDAEKRSSDDFSTIINFLLRSEGESIPQIVHERIGLPSFRMARTLIFFTFGAILYYVGLMLRSVKNEECDVYFAGGGSKFLTWIKKCWRPGGQPIPIMDCVPLKQILTTATHPIRIETSFRCSEHPKQEVGLGLLQGEFETVAKHSTIIGESGYKFKDDELDWDHDLVKFEHMYSGSMDKIIVPHEFSELRKFLGVFDICAERLTLNKVQSLVENREIRAWMQNRFKNVGDVKAIQSFFIEEVKATISRYLMSSSDDRASPLKDV